jgi:hypothetical protein
MASASVSSKMTALSDEILLLITEHIERKFLPAFIVVSRRKRNLGTPILYRFIEFP